MVLVRPARWQISSALRKCCRTQPPVTGYSIRCRTTRYGRLSSPIAAFLEQATEQLGQDVLSGKVGGAFTSPTSAQGGQETASMSLVINLLHLGMIVVGPPFSVTTIADAAGQRYPSELDLDIARQQGTLIARTAQKLKGPGSVLRRKDPAGRDAVK